MNQDDVKQPAHYTQGDMECIEAIRGMLGHNVVYAYKANILKYVWRYEHKGGVQDLEKALEYLEMLAATERRGDGLL